MSEEPHTTLTVPVEAWCSHPDCDRPIRTGEQGVWVRGRGMFHPECFAPSEEPPEKPLSDAQRAVQTKGYTAIKLPADEAAD